jgi:UDP-N-acetyl-D-glucosamine dehydrogenase
MCSLKMTKGLKKKIKKRTAKIAIIGLGYVGLPIALEFSRAGFKVFGLDTNEKRIKGLLNKCSYILDISSQEIRKALNRKNFFPTSDYKVLKEVDIIIICVPTPLRKRKMPNISYIIKASRSISKYLKKAGLVIVESTTYPGTTRDVILPILSKGGLVEGRDFFLAFSPERIDPGNERYTLANIPKVVGGISKKAGELSRDIYSKIIKKVVMVSSAETAEIIKLLENSFRIVNIGLINEFAMLCNKLKIDVWEVVRAAETKPFGFMPFYPGPGIGGHCIPADPLYLSWKARRLGFKTKMIDLASRTNLFMPYYVCQRVEELLSQRGIDISKARILILGVTYKRDVNDLRESPALDIIEILQEKGARVFYCDPFIPYLRINKINLQASVCTAANIRKSDLLVLVTDHTKFHYKSLAKNAKLILDTRNVFEHKGLKDKKIIKL